MKNLIAISFSIIALVVAIIAICKTAPTIQPLDFDYLGLIVGILSLLVTALLGWQIYSVITVENRLKKLSDLYQNISRKSLDLEATLEQNKHYIKALVLEIETSSYYRDDIKNPDLNIDRFSNTYIRYIETFKLFILAKDKKYPALCLLNADLVLTNLSDRIKAGEQLNRQFNKICDKLYQEIIPFMENQEVDIYDFLHNIRARRKSLNTSHHNPPVTNPYGVKQSSYRIPT